MVATTLVRFLVRVNYGVDFKKIPSPVKLGLGVSKSVEGFFFLQSGGTTGPFYGKSNLL
jgi:hypothetical protein